MPTDHGNTTSVQTPDSHVRKPRHRRATKVMFVVLLLLLVLVGGLLTAWLQFRPAGHFTATKRPVIAVPQKPATTASTPPPLANGEFNLVLFGIDARQPNEAARTDTIMVVHADLTAHDYEIISIPRDTRVDLPGYGYTKITHANFMGELNGGLSKGTQDAISAVSSLTGLQINYYAETSFSGLTDMVNTLGGISMYVPFDVKLSDAPHTVVTKGNQFLDGATLLRVVRERHNLPNGDFGRQQLQEEAVIGMVRALESPSNLSRIPQLEKELPNFLVATNLSFEDMTSFAMALRGFSQDQVHYYQVPGHDAYEVDPIVKTKLYYWIADTSQLNQIIEQHFTH